MPTQVRFRRGNTAQNNNFTGASGEISINTSNNTIRVHDGTTAGGTELATVAHVTNSIANVIDSAPALLDTLNELAAAINDDPNFYSTIATSAGAARDQANAAYDRANVGVTYAGAAFDKANTLVATVAGVSSTNISNTNLLDGIKAVDGSSSGLDADLLDGQDGSYYLDWTNTTNKPDPVITVTMTGDVTGSASATLADVTSNTITIATTIANNSVALGTDTTGDYVQNVLPGTGIVVTGTPGESRDATVALDTSGVVATTYGGSSKVPVFTVDTYGRITSAANVNVAGVSTFSASGNTFTISTADGGSFSASIQENSVRLGTDTTGAYVANLVAGTGVSLSGLGNEGTTPTIAIGQDVSTTSDVTFRDLTITGNVTVTGGTFLANANVLVVEDPLVQYAYGNPGDAFDIGFVGHYNDSGTEKHAGLFRDATDKVFKFFANTTIEPTGNVVDITSGGFELANVQARFFLGDGSGLNNINASNVSTGTLSLSRLAASTISGKTLGNDLDSLTAGTGLSGTAFNGSAAQTWTLATSGVSAGSYGGSTVIPAVVVDTYGRITSVSNATVSVANTNITGNIIASQIAPTGVTASTYGGANQISSFTVDAQGRLTSAANVATTSITQLGTITTGAWNASSISTTYTDAKIVAVSNTAPIGATTTSGTTTVTHLNSGVTASTYGGADNIPVLVVNATGHVTSASNVATTSIATLGTVTTGTWNATVISTTYGGTGNGQGYAGGGAASSNTITVVNDTSTNATWYPMLGQATSGNTAPRVSSTKLTFNASSGLLTSTDYNSSSDKRLKKDIKVIENALEKISALKGVNFVWKESKQPSIGLIAQDVQKVLPECVTSDDNGYLGVKYNNIIGVLVQAIKEQQDQINTLKKQIEKLNG